MIQHKKCVQKLFPFGKHFGADNYELIYLK